MSDDEGRGGGSSGVGSFILGVAIGAAIGFLFAPEAGRSTRAKVSSRLRALKEYAGEKAGELVDQVVSVEEEEPEEAPLSAREELERRLGEARRRRRTGSGKALRRGTAAEVEEEDEPVA